MNAVCPLVTKVHHEAKVRAGKGFTVLYVGHEGHDEATGTLAVAPEAMRLVEREDDLDAVLPTVADPSKVALLAQTTLSVNDWQGDHDACPERFPELWTATRNDLCFATTNRQAALPRHRGAGRRHRGDRQRQLVEHASPSTKVAARPGCERVLRIDGPDEIDADTLGDARIVGVTAGASAPEDLVQAVIARLAPVDGVETGARHRRGRVLPSAARAARSSPARLRAVRTVVAPHRGDASPSSRRGGRLR